MKYALAATKMSDDENSGVSTVFLIDKETYEHYVEQFSDKRITSFVYGETHVDEIEKVMDNTIREP